MRFRGYTGNLNKNPGPVNVDRMRNQPMGPGQSMAMAGNTGLAGFSESDIVNLQKGTERAGNKMSFADLGKYSNEMGSKYPRPTAINQSFLFSDDSNRKITPSMLDSQGNFMPFTASAPTLSQLFGDASRAFGGYNSLKYPEPNMQGPMPEGQNRNMMFMQRTPGMLSGAMDYFTGGGMLGKVFTGAKNLFDTGIGAFRGESQYTAPSAMQKNSVMGLSPLQQVVYNRVISIPGKTHQEAYEAATRQDLPTGLAMGGIARLN